MFCCKLTFFHILLLFGHTDTHTLPIQSLREKRIYLNIYFRFSVLVQNPKRKNLNCNSR